MADTETLPDETVEITTLLARGAASTGSSPSPGPFASTASSRRDQERRHPRGRTWAQVKADVDVGTLIVEGEVEGTIQARRAVRSIPRASARQHHDALAVHRPGVVFEATATSRIRHADRAGAPVAPASRPR